MYNGIRLFCTPGMWPTLLSRVVGTALSLGANATTAWSLTLSSNHCIHRARWIPVNFYLTYEITQLYFAHGVREVDTNTVSVQQVESQPYNEQVALLSVAEFRPSLLTIFPYIFKNNFKEK
jgi:hypothetical protein